MKKILLASLAVGLLSVLYAEDINYTNIGPYGGLNNTDSPLAIPANKAADLLNVDVSPGGKSVSKRKGFSLFSNLEISTSPGHGAHKFFDASGNSVALYFNDTRISASINGGAMTVLSSTGPSGATWQCVDSQGFAYCNNTERTSLLKTNGVTFSYINTVNSTGTMVAVTPERLAISGFDEAPNRLDIGKANDFTNWVVGSEATSATQFTIVSPGSRITHIVYAFGRIIWFKDSSFGFIYIGQEAAQADWQVKIIDPTVGSVDNTSVYWDGVLYFRGQDGHIYGYDGANLTKLTRDLEGVISVSQSRSQGSWEQTNQADFQAGQILPSAFLSTSQSAGEITTLVASVTSYFHDTSTADFNSGTLSTVGIHFSSGISLFPNGSYEQKKEFLSPGVNLGEVTTNAHFRSFTANSSFNLGRVQWRMECDADLPSDTFTVALWSDASTSPSQVLASTSIPIVGLPTTVTFTTFTFNTLTPLASGNRYWISAETTNDDSNCFLYRINTAATDSTEYSTFDSLLPSVQSGGRYDYRVYNGTYSASGDFLSQTFDVGYATNTFGWGWNPFQPVTVEPTDTSITYETQTSSDSSCASCWESLVSVASGAITTSAKKRYIRYKASLSTSDNSKSPILYAVSMSVSTSSFFSQVKNAPSLSEWDVFQVTKNDSGGRFAFFLRASTDWFSVLSTTPTWENVQNGQIPEASTGTYFQVRADFYAGVSSHTPSLQDFTVNWIEGQASDKSYATYFKDAIWWSVASGVSVSTNNRIMRLDLLNGDWYLYDIGTNGMAVVNNSLYFVGSGEGKVFKFGDVDNDNGAPINAYWKSKDFVLGNPFVQKEFVNLSVSAGSVANSSMTVTYTIDGSSSTSYQFPLYAGSDFYKHFNKNLPLGRVGSTFNVLFGNNAADQPWEVFAVQYGFRDKPWVPTP